MVRTVGVTVPQRAVECRTDGEGGTAVESLKVVCCATERAICSLENPAWHDEFTVPFGNQGFFGVTIEGSQN